MSIEPLNHSTPNTQHSSVDTFTPRKRMVCEVQTYGLAPVNMVFKPLPSPLQGEGVHRFTFNPQSSIFNFQFSIFNLQSSIFNPQFSIFNFQSSIFNEFFKKPQYLPKSSGMPLYKGFADREVCLGNLPHTSLIPPSHSCFSTLSRDKK